MACPECFPNRQQRGRGVCPGLSLRPGSMYPGEGTVKLTPSVMRALRPQGGRSSPGETEAFPFRLPGPQGGVWHVPGCFLPRTATGGYNRPVGLAGGIYLVYSGDRAACFGSQLKRSWAGGECRGRGTSATAETLPNGKVTQAKENGPAPSRRGRSMANVGMRSGGAASCRNRHKTDTDTEKQSFSRNGKKQQGAGRICGKPCGAMD